MIDTDIRDWVATIEAPDFTPLSRYDHEFARELRDLVVEFSDHDEVKAIVLRTHSADFASATHGRPRDSASFRRDFSGASAIYQALCFAKKIVITEVSGACHGAGSLLVLCSDLTIAAKDSVFGSPFAGLPESNFVLAALTVRLNRAKAWAFTGDLIPAEQAARIGLINHVVPAEQLAGRTAELASEVTAMPLDGVTMSKMLLQSVLDAQGVGREFDMAPHYARHLWSEVR